MNKENCALKLVDEIILYYDARSKKKHQIGLLYVLISIIQTYKSLEVFAATKFEETQSRADMIRRIPASIRSRIVRLPVL